MSDSYKIFDPNLVDYGDDWEIENSGAGEPVVNDINLPNLELTLIRQVPLKPEWFRKSPELYYLCETAHKSFHDRDFPKAVQLYSEILQENYLSEACLGLAISYYFIGDYQNAKVMMNKVTQELYVNTNTDLLSLLLIERSGDQASR